MSFGTILSTIFLGPLKLIFETVFVLANRMFQNPGLAIIALSVTINTLVLPLYKRADVMQKEARDVEEKLRDGIAHIKKSFSGDEKMMILQTYYRQNNYSPLSSIKGSISLFLQIPFFMAAYQFLSQLELLKGVSFGPIKDLGVPDGLLVIGGLSINLLPILMTLINFISSTIYLRGFPVKTKVQLYGMATFFLVFLYRSPSGLVFYWTLNNLYSLGKTIFFKISSKKARNTLLAALGVVIIVLSAINIVKHTFFSLLLLPLGIVLMLPTASPLFKKFSGKIKLELQPNRAAFTVGSILMTVLMGVLIPSSFISDSPLEFVDVTNFYNPNWYVVSAVCLAIGVFLVWMQVFYALANKKIQALCSKLILALCCVATVDYMFFGTDIGVILPTLKYISIKDFAAKEILINLVIVALIAAVAVFVSIKWKSAASIVLATALIALTGMSVKNVAATQRVINDFSVEKANENNENINLPLNKNGKNVVVLMLDRAVSEFVPYIMNEKPELKEKFDGFTFYENTISFGGHTNIATPALMGGYEYTPVEINRRDKEPLAKKHNEAVKLLPDIFWNNGYKVTLSDPIYANYKWISDLSIFDEYEGLNAFFSYNRYPIKEQQEFLKSSLNTGFFRLSLMKVSPILLQTFLYDSGKYLRGDSSYWVSQTYQGLSKATGAEAEFLEEYAVIDNLTDMTLLSDSSENTFTFMVNNVTHEPAYLQTPDYVPSYSVDNEQYDKQHEDRFTVNGKVLKIEAPIQMAHYHVNMAAFLRIGEWLDYLRENGVYDNTRIIIVADHGGHTGSVEVLSDEGHENYEWFVPLLMVKDFDSKGFSVSDEFMTNADVPYLAVNGLIENPKNPFTGKPLSIEEKTAHPQYICASHESRYFDITYNNGTTFKPSNWISVEKNIWDADNWKEYPQEIVLKENKIPN